MIGGKVARWFVAVLVVAGCDTSALEEAEDLTSYDVAGSVTALDLIGGSGSVEITVADGPVRVRERRLYNGVPPLTSHRVEGGTLHLLDQGCGKAAEAEGQCETHYQVKVPRGLAVTVTDLAGTLDVTTDVGAIKGSGLTGKTKATTSVGDVELRYTAAPPAVEVTNEVGATQVFLPVGGAYRIDAKTAAGPAVNLPSSPDAKSTVTLHSDTGAITVAPA